MSALQAVVTAPIRFYMRFVSPLLPRRCKYLPTCSEYGLTAIREYGVARGLVLATWRVLRCNPFSHGGWDPATDQRLFDRPPRSAAAASPPSRTA